MAPVPQSIGIIMDGNRRWAKAKGLPTLEGHRAGYDKLRDVVSWCRDRGVGALTVYAFSTENWNRSEEEVGYLMNLLRSVVADMAKEAKANDTRLVFIGDRTRFAQDIVTLLNDAEALTSECKKFIFGVCLSYGGRAEILDAVRRVPEEKRATMNEEEFSKLLWTKEIPDPDLIIRTSGEERLSNFLPWQSIYSELFFTETLWPDFSEEEFEMIFTNFTLRERRRGK